VAEPFSNEPPPPPSTSFFFPFPFHFLLVFSNVDFLMTWKNMGEKFYGHTIIYIFIPCQKRERRVPSAA